MIYHNEKCALKLARLAAIKAHKLDDATLRMEAATSKLQRRRRGRLAGSILDLICGKHLTKTMRGGGWPPVKRSTWPLNTLGLSGRTFVMKTNGNCRPPLFIIFGPHPSLPSRRHASLILIQFSIGGGWNDDDYHHDDDAKTPHAAEFRQVCSLGGASDESFLV